MDFPQWVEELAEIVDSYEISNSIGLFEKIGMMRMSIAMFSTALITERHTINKKIDLSTKIYEHFKLGKRLSVHQDEAMIGVVEHMLSIMVHILEEEVEPREEYLIN